MADGKKVLRDWDSSFRDSVQAKSDKQMKLKRRSFRDVVQYQFNKLKSNEITVFEFVYYIEAALMVFNDEPEISDELAKAIKDKVVDDVYNKLIEKLKERFSEMSKMLEWLINEPNTK